MPRRRWTFRALALAGILTSAACHRYVSVEEQGLIEPKSGSPGDRGSSAIGATGGDKRLSVTGAGTSLERVTNDPVDELSPTANRDGTSILFQVETYDGTGADRKLKQQTLVGTDPNVHGSRTLYTSTERFAHSPAWMPDGQSYVYVTNAMGPLAVVRALTSTPNAAMAVIISSDLAPDPQTPTLSPDGLRVAFSMRSVDGGRNIAIVGTDGSKFTVLGEGRTPSWSPDGKQLAFIRTVNGYNHLFLVDPVTGTGLVQVTSGNWDCDHPSWSPDSTWIAFASNRGYEELKLARDRVLHLFAVKRNGTGLVQLTQGASMAGAPSWGRDGWVYFASNREGNYDIWRIRPTFEGAQPAPVASASASASPSAAPPASASAAPPASASASATPAPSASAEPPKPPEPTGCSTDFDCKGDRVCEWGNCVVPKTGQQKQVMPRTPPKK